MNRITTGIKTLDSIIDGGFPENSTILISGSPGSGKTLFSLNFLLEGARKNERCCYISLSETKDELIKACEGIKQLNEVKKHLGKTLAIEHITCLLYTSPSPRDRG